MSSARHRLLAGANSYSPTGDRKPTSHRRPEPTVVLSDTATQAMVSSGDTVTLSRRFVEAIRVAYVDGNLRAAQPQELLRLLREQLNGSGLPAWDDQAAIAALYCLAELEKIQLPDDEPSLV